MCFTTFPTSFSLITSSVWLVHVGRDKGTNALGDDCGNPGDHGWMHVNMLILSTEDKMRIILKSSRLFLTAK